MAGSRVEKLGTIFTRVQGLLKTGALKEADRPIWHEVMAAFPPRVEPVFERFERETEPRNILYKEDVTRAMFYKTYQTSEVINLKDHSTPTVSQRFIEKYQSMLSDGLVEETKVTGAVIEALRVEGFSIKTMEEVEQERQQRAQTARENKRKAKSSEGEAGAAKSAEEVFGQTVGGAEDLEDTYPVGEDPTDTAPEVKDR